MSNPATIDGYSIATLVIFVFSIVFVIFPVVLRFQIKLRRVRLPLNLVTVPVLAVLLLLAAQCISISVVRDGIVGTDGIKPFNILILFFSLAYMAITLDLTGILQAAAFWVSNKGGTSGWRLFTYFYILLLTMGLVMGNDPVILSGTAFLVYYTRVTEVSPTAWLFSEFTACNTASMVLFIGNPTNVVLCEGFGISYLAFTAYTIVPFLFCAVASFGALAFQFRDPKYIPRHVLSPHLEPRSVLLDPVGAAVGSAMLIMCLVLIIGVSFAGVDVWEISMPFALAKLCFDFAWDEYRFRKRSDHEETRATDPLTIPGSVAGQEASSNIELERMPSTLNKRTASRQAKSRPSRTSDRRKAAFARRFKLRYPTISTAFPRLPFALLPFAFAQFILVEALGYTGWIDLFASWLAVATSRNPLYITVWLVGVLGVLLCNISGTNIGATILLSKVLKASPIGADATLAGAVALAVASNIGAMGFCFAASLAGLLWRTILRQKGIVVKQRDFARWNMVPLVVLTVVGLATVSVEMRILAGQ